MKPKRKKNTKLIFKMWTFWIRFMRARVTDKEGVKEVKGKEKTSEMHTYSEKRERVIQRRKRICSNAFQFGGNVLCTTGKRLRRYYMYTVYIPTTDFTFEFTFVCILSGSKTR